MFDNNACTFCPLLILSVTSGSSSEFRASDLALIREVADSILSVLPQSASFSLAGHLSVNPTQIVQFNSRVLHSTKRLSLALQVEPHAGSIFAALVLIRGAFGAHPSYSFEPVLATRLLTGVEAWIKAVKVIRPKRMLDVCVAPSILSQPPTRRGRYIPSKLEKEWRRHAAIGLASVWTENPCAHLASATIVRWIQAVRNSTRGRGVSYDPEIFSRWEDGSRVEWIEPLAGILRHPGFPCDSGIWHQNKEYLMVNERANLDPVAGEATFAQRKILLDAGAGEFRSSLEWFVAAYKKRGIIFDRIYAWETDPTVWSNFWQHVPSQYVSRLTLFTAPASANRSSMLNPVTLLCHVCKPHDFCVLKIDLNSPRMESQLLKQITHTPVALSILDEFFWEHQVAGIMQSFGWNIEVPFGETYADSYSHFTALREAGIRAHSWV